LETITNSDRIAALVSQLIQQGTEFAFSLVSAVIILIAGYIVAGWATRKIEARLQRAEKFDATLVPIIGQVVRYVILGFTVVLVLAQFGVQTASLIAAIGAAGLAIGLALQGTLQNVAAGMMLLILRPFQVGDWIEAAGQSGTAEEIGLFMTRLQNFEGLYVAVPNSKIWADTIVNHSRNPHRQLVLDAGISYDDDIDRARQVLRDMVEADERILRRPAPPAVLVTGYGDSAVNLQIRAWTRNTDYWDVRFDMTRTIKYALDEARITIPYPHRQVILSGNGADQARLTGQQREAAEGEASTAAAAPRTRRKRARGDAANSQES